MVYVIRPVKDDDSQALIRLISSCYEEYPGCFLELEGEEKWLKAPATYYEREGGLFRVVEVNGMMICACIGLRFYEPNGAEPKTLYVAKYARNRGIATTLMRLAEGYAKMRGVKVWNCWSDTRFTDAHRLYEQKLGYRRTGRTRELHDLSNTVEYEFTKEF